MMGYSTGATKEGDGDWKPDNPPTTSEVARLREEIDEILLLIASTSRMGGMNSADYTLINIIRDGAADYFNGIISAADAARIIQSSVSLYISERS